MAVMMRNAVLEANGFPPLSAPFLPEAAILFEASEEELGMLIQSIYICT